MIKIAKLSQSKVSIAYKIIKERIMSETYKFGQVLSATSLSEELDMSRTPILEAFKMLESEGIVRVVPQVGVIVRPLNPDRVFGIFTIRAILEGYVAGEAAKKKVRFEIKDQAMKLIEEMQQCIEKGDVDRYAELNMKFHQMIIDTLDNHHIKETIMQLWDLSHYVNARKFVFAENMQQSYQEHKDCLEAIMAGDSEKARRVMEEHIYRSREKILRLLQD
ncbi:GntR family transcriptional regulator [Geobacillus genomosp. 3]|uniref:GntR family transcriptional regulator n=1 Tax=Geobacillus genomosp. 3 TaxID=1921421 RepID=UPI00130D8A10|nr:GntR family transcriptional regulator [Geobacillus genomosp. 3]